MDGAGTLSLEIGWNGREIAAVRVSSGRPVLASRVLEGRAVREAVAMVPRLFSVCSRSQHVAAQVACAFAAGEATERQMAQGELEVLAECALESLWWLMLDWPARLGEPPRREFAIARTRLLRLTESESVRWDHVADELESLVTSQPQQRIMEGLMAQLRTRASAEVHVPMLPWLDARALRETLAPALDAGDDFSRAPQWRGAPAETGSLARRAIAAPVAAAGVAERVGARLDELASIPGRMRALAGGATAIWVRGAQTAQGSGIAAVETARGTLVHRVALVDGTVRRWRIVAPTEWNFHPEGAYVRGLVGLDAPDAQTARRAGELLACSLDPCVEYKVAVGHA